jgi:hypothetical protein
MQRRGGTISFKIDGVLYDAKGNFTYNLGRPKRESIIGSDGVHGYKETPQPAFIEGEITDRGDLNLDALVSMSSATVTLELSNGKLIVLSEGTFTGEGTGNSDEGNIAVRFEGTSADEVS